MRPHWGIYPTGAEVHLLELGRSAILILVAQISKAGAEFMPLGA